MRHCLVFLLMFIFWVDTVSAQDATPYQVPSTEHGHPDFQGLWTTGFSTMMERPEGIESLVVPEDLALRIAQSIHGNFVAGVTDPDFDLMGVLPLARVRGEYRSSIVTVPEDGRIPFTQLGAEMAGETNRLVNEGMDGPEQRPLEERCLASMVFPPVRALPLDIPIVIVQNRDHMVLSMEDAAGFRLLRIGFAQPGEHMRSYEGYSTAAWEGETLVIRTTHFREDNPGRINIPNPVLIGADTRVTERLTRVSESELNYQFTVEDPAFYAEPWSGEFSLRSMAGQSYEYSCHEGNYSLSGILRGGRVLDLDAERQD